MDLLEDRITSQLVASRLLYRAVADKISKIWSYRLAVWIFSILSAFYNQLQKNIYTIQSTESS